MTSKIPERIIGCGSLVVIADAAPYISWSVRAMEWSMVYRNAVCYKVCIHIARLCVSSRNCSALLVCKSTGWWTIVGCSMCT